MDSKRLRGSHRNLVALAERSGFGVYYGDGASGFWLGGFLSVKKRAESASNAHEFGGDYLVCALFRDCHRDAQRTGLARRGGRLCIFVGVGVCHWGGGDSGVRVFAVLVLVAGVDLIPHAYLKPYTLYLQKCKYLESTDTLFDR